MQHRNATLLYTKVASQTFAGGWGGPRSILGAPDVPRPNQGPNSAAVADGVAISVGPLFNVLRLRALHDRRLGTIHRWRCFRAVDRFWFSKKM